jgi:hypothetical protein
LTPEQHNKYLSWAHFAHAGFSAFFMLLAMGFMTAIMMVDPKAPPAPFFAVVWVFFAAITALMVVPSLVAGYGLKKRKHWARTMCIVAGVLAATSAPIGTAVCIYTFWFLFSEPGKLLYDNPQRMLPQQRDVPWARRSEAKEEHYVAPPSPPDWR